MFKMLGGNNSPTELFLLDDVVWSNSHTSSGSKRNSYLWEA